jgi:hypothetical protein
LSGRTALLATLDGADGGLNGDSSLARAVAPGGDNSMIGVRRCRTAGGPGEVETKGVPRPEPDSRRPRRHSTSSPGGPVALGRGGDRTLTFDEDAGDAVHPRVKVSPGSGNHRSVDDLRIDAGHGGLDPQHLADLPDLGLHRLREPGRHVPGKGCGTGSLVDTTASGRGTGPPAGTKIA